MPSRALRRCFAGAVMLLPAMAGAQRGAVPRSVVRHVQHLTAEEGLAENNIRSLARDGTGFIWVVTRGGLLQRYDGHSFVDFRQLAPGTNDLARDVRVAIVDPRGALWVFADGTLFRVSGSHQPDRRIALDSAVTAASIDPNGRLWFVDGDVLKSIETAGSEPAPHRWNRLEGVTLGIAAGRRDLWILSGNGVGFVVERLNPGTSLRQRFPLPVISPMGIVEDPLGQVWVNGELGLAVLEPGADAFRAAPDFRNRRSTAPVPDESGTRIVSTDDWLARIDSTGTVVEYFTSPDAFGRSALPNGIVADPEGGAWLATTTRGLLRLQTRAPPFALLSNSVTPPFPLASNFVTALRERSDGAFWIGTLRGGAYRVSAGGEHVRRVPIRFGSTSTLDYDVWDFEEDRNGNLWIAAADGVCRLVADAFRCQPVSGGAVDIEATSDGWFLIAQYINGVVSFDPQAERLGPRLEQVARQSLDKPVVSLLSEPDSGFLWMGVGHLLARARLEQGRMIDSLTLFDSPLRPSDLVYQFHRDRQGNLLVATGGGLLRMVRDSGRTRFAFVPGMVPRASTIFSIAEDSAGRIWLGSAHGLIQYSPASGIARRYGRRDHFLSGELNRRAALVRRSGELLFGGVEGLTQFDPAVVAASRVAMPLVFTRLSRMTARGPSVASIVGLPELRLEPRDRSFTIEFAELSYAPNPGRRYRYRLEGLNSDWVETTDHSATYAAPPPGQYEFRVQSAAGGDESWSSPGLSIMLDVAPPFYNTAWFKLLLLWLTVVIIWLAHRWKVRQAVLTERLRLRISRDLHDEIGAGLSSIALLSDTSSPSMMAERAQLKRIGESARNMVGDLRDIVWAIDPEADRGRDVEGRMRDVAAGLLRDVKITYDFHTHGTAHVDMETRRDLLRLYKEILHNVARHSRATEVRIALQMSADAIALTVSDNGVGFSPEGTRTGTGLKSLRERATRLDGSLVFDSAPGRGTTVRFARQRSRDRKAAGNGNAD